MGEFDLGDVQLEAVPEDLSIGHATWRRSQVTPPHFTTGQPDAGVKFDDLHTAAALDRCSSPRGSVFCDDLLEQQTWVRHQGLRGEAMQIFDACTDVDKLRSPVAVTLDLADHAAGQVVTNGANEGFAAAQGGIGGFKLRGAFADLRFDRAIRVGQCLHCFLALVHLAAQPGEAQDEHGGTERAPPGQECQCSAEPVVGAVHAVLEGARHGSELSLHRRSDGLARIKVRAASPGGQRRGLTTLEKYLHRLGVRFSLRDDQLFEQGPIKLRHACLACQLLDGIDVGHDGRHSGFIKAQVTSVSGKNQPLCTQLCVLHRRHQVFAFEQKLAHQKALCRQALRLSKAQGDLGADEKQRQQRSPKRKGDPARQDITTPLGPRPRRCGCAHGCVCAIGWLKCVRLHLK